MNMLVIGKEVGKALGLGIKTNFFGGLNLAKVALQPTKYFGDGTGKLLDAAISFGPGIAYALDGVSSFSDGYTEANNIYGSGTVAQYKHETNNHAISAALMMGSFGRNPLLGAFMKAGGLLLNNVTNFQAYGLRQLDNSSHKEGDSLQQGIMGRRFFQRWDNTLGMMVENEWMLRLLELDKFAEEDKKNGWASPDKLKNGTAYAAAEKLKGNNPGRNPFAWIWGAEEKDAPMSQTKVNIEA